MKTKFLIGLLIIAIVLTSGCEIKKKTVFKVSFTSATITDAKPCEAVDKDNNPIGITYNFTPESPEINICFTWEHAPKGTNLKAVWIYETKNQVITESSIIINDIGGQGHFKLTKPTTKAGWPLGDYRADLYLGDKLAKSVSFKVQAKPEPKPSYNWITYRDPTFKFSFMHPEEGTIEVKGNVVYIRGSKDEKGHTPNINIQIVVSAELGGKYKNIDEAATSGFSQLSTAENYNLISDTSTTIDGENAREIITSYSYDELNIKQNNAYVQDPKAGTIYVIGYTATTLTYPKYTEVYEKVKETFRLPK